MLINVFHKKFRIFFSQLTYTSRCQLAASNRQAFLFVIIVFLDVVLSCSDVDLAGRAIQGRDTQAAVAIAIDDIATMLDKKPQPPFCPKENLEISLQRLYFFIFLHGRWFVLASIMQCSFSD
jgi:hypothetical protein